MPDPRDRQPLVHRKTADGETQVAASWESLIDRQICEAMDEGKFDNLPFQGEPLPSDENPYAGDRALAFHVLKNAGVAPPWIEADKEVRELVAKREAIFARAAAGAPPSTFARQRDRRALEELVIAISRAIARVNAEAPTDRQHRRPLTVADELAAYDAACRRGAS